MAINNNDIYEMMSELNRLIKGEVFDNGDHAYSETIKIDNSRIEHEPYLVVFPENAEDVKAVISYCVRNKIKMTTKSGGHSATGYSLNSDGVVMDLKRMNAIRYVDNKYLLEVGAGAKWIEIYNFLRNMRDQRIVVGGGCPGVGVAGFLLGGGFSFLSRSFGLGSDNVEEIQIVTADGVSRTVGTSSTAPEEKDLFWALRGGGGGNFGVATKFKLKLHEVENPLMVGQIVFPFYRIKEILPVYEELCKSTSEKMAIYGMMRTFADPRNDGRPFLSLRFTPIFNGKYSQGIKDLEPLLDLKPITSEFHSMTLPEWENYIGSATKVEGRSAYIRSVVMESGSLVNAIDIFKYYMTRKPSRDSYIVWTQTGGQMKNMNRDSVYPHRDSSYVVEVKSIWNQTDAQLTRMNVEWAYDFFEDLSKYGSGAYLNYIDPLLTDWKEKYYGKNYERLEKIKEQFDETGFFSFQQSIGSVFNPKKPDRKRTDLDYTNTPVDLSPLKKTF